MNLLEIGLILLICMILATVTYSRSMLDITGSLTAFIIGVLIGVMGGIFWIFILLIFLGSSFLATRYKFKYKKKIGLQEGKKGERSIKNVLANGLVPVFLAILYDSSNYLSFGEFKLLGNEIVIFLFVTSIAAAAADTLASEMGILSKDVYLITTGKKVVPGTNGGISLRGEIWAFIGSIYTFFIASLVFGYFQNIYLSFYWIPLGIFMGFVSCQIDSILGATLERKEIIGKSTVNLLAISTTIIITGVIIWIIKF